MKVLIFSPHPDDAELGMGGSIVKHKNIDDYVVIVYVTSGGFTDNTKEREQEVISAENILGANELKFLRWEDHNVKATEENREKIMDIIKEINPHIVYCPCPEEQHIDHKAVFEMVSKAVNVPLYLYEVYPGMSPVEEYEDITNTINKKMLALKEFKSQKCDLAEAYRHHAKFRGIMSGIEEY